MVLAASGSNSAAGATMKSAAQSNTKSTGPGGPNGPNSGPSVNGSGPRGPTGPSNSQPRSSPAGNAGGGPGASSRTSGNGGLGQGGQGSGVGSGGGLGGGNKGPSGPNGPNSGPSTNRGPTNSAQANGDMGYKGGPPNAAAAKASAALNAGLGKPVTGALNTQRAIGVGGAALGSFKTATEPVVRNYLSSPQSLADQQAGWSNLARTAQARLMARDALALKGPTYPMTPQGVFGPRANAGAKYLSQAHNLGMITTGMPSELSGMPKRSIGTYSGYGTFNVPNVPPRNTTVVTKNSTYSPVTALPDGTLVSSNQVSEVYKTPQTLAASMARPPSPAMSVFSDLGVRRTMNPQERILAVEDVPPLGTSVQGGLGVLGISSPVNSIQPLNVPSQSTREQRDMFYGGGPTPPSLATVPDYAQSTYTGRAPSVPSWQQSAYVGPEPSGPIGAVMRDEPYNMPVKPYGAKTANAIDAVVRPLPVIGQINDVLKLGKKSAGNIFVDEENKLANMTPEQRERYRTYYANQRANAPGQGDTSRGSRYDSTALQAYRNATSPAPDTPTTDAPSGPWEADALAYGYSSDQLKDPETRALIKQLWEMGFIPKTTKAS